MQLGRSIVTMTTRRTQHRGDQKRRRRSESSLSVGCCACSSEELESPGRRSCCPMHHRHQHQDHSPPATQRGMKRRRTLSSTSSTPNLLLLSAVAKRRNVVRSAGAQSSTMKSGLLRVPVVLVSLVCFGSLLVAVGAQKAQQPFAECYRHLHAADANQDSLLSQEEYPDALRLTSNGALAPSDFASLTPDLVQAFEAPALTAGGGQVDISGVTADPTTTPPTDTQQAVLNPFCTNVYSSLITALSIPTTTTQCYLAMSIADSNRNDELDTIEYPKFLSRLSANYIALTTPFESLKPSLQTLYTDFAAGPVEATLEQSNVVPIPGTKPGQTPDALVAPILETFCEQVAIAIAGEKVKEANGDTGETDTGTGSGSGTGGTGSGGGNDDSGVSPPDTGTGTGTGGGGGGGLQIAPVPFRQCTLSLVVSDLNRDDALDQKEYYNFLNRLTGDKVKEAGMTSYETLPKNLQDNFNENAEGTTISVVGSKPGTTPTEAQTLHLEELCASTQKALNSDGDGGGGGDGGDNPPPPPPTDPTLAPTPKKDDGSGGGDVVVPPFSFQTCTLSMATSDLDRSLDLNPTEYVTFINKVGGNRWSGEAYDNLPLPLQTNYDALSGTAEGPGISIDGSFPGRTPSDEQLNHLERVCDDTYVAIEEAVNPKPATETPGATLAPTVADTPEVPVIVVYNAFVMFNTKGLTEANITSGKEEFDQLNEAYGKFVIHAVDSFLGKETVERRQRRMLRGGETEARNLLITGVAADPPPELYEVLDITCPDSVTSDGAQCQTAYGKFSLDFGNEDDLDAATKLLTGITQTAITDEDNGLQSFLDVGNTTSDFRIQGVPTNGVLTPGGPPQEPPPNTVPPVGGDGEESNSGFIILVAIIAAAGLAVIGVSYWLCFGREGGACDCFSKGGGKNIPKIGKSETAKTDDASAISGYGSQLPPPPGNPLSTDAPSSPGSKRNGIAGLFDGGNSPRGSTGTGANEESLGFSVQEQSPTRSGSKTQDGKGQKGFGVFGKRKSSSQHDDDAHDQEVFEDEPNDYGDEDKYDFDDPTCVPSDINRASAHGSSEGGNSDWNPQMSPGQPGGFRKRAVDPWAEDNDASRHRTPGYAPSILSASSETDSDTDSEDDSEDESTESSGSDTYMGDGDESYAKSKDENATAIASDVLPDHMKGFDDMVDRGDWDGVIEQANEFDGGNDENSYIPNPNLRKGMPEESDSESSGERFGSKASQHSKNRRKDGNAGQDAPSVVQSLMSMTSTERRQREKYKAQVEELVRKVVPDEADNIDAMMDQFLGREPELINTLQTMYDRSSSIRARKAVHKSKAIPEAGANRYASGGAEGSAAVAAASTIGQGGFERGAFDDEGSFEEDYENDERGEADDQFGDDHYDDDEQEPYGDDGFDDDDDDAERFNDEYDDGDYDRQSQGSYSGDDSRGRDDDYDDGEGSYRDDQEPYGDDGFDNEDDRERFDDQYDDGDYDGQSQGSYISGDSRGQDDDYGDDQYYDDGEGSYHDDQEPYGDDGFDEEGDEGRFDDQDDGEDYDGQSQGSYREGDNQEHSNENGFDGEGSYYSDEGDDYGDDREDNRRDFGFDDGQGFDDEGGSYHDGEGSGSFGEDY